MPRPLRITVPNLPFHILDRGNNRQIVFREDEGFEGLKHLKIGDQISISSSENIRGKTEFTIDYINKL